MGRKGKSTLVSSNNRSSSKSVGVALQPVKTLSNEIVAPADENCMTQSVVTGTKKKRVTILEDSTANGRDDAACVTLDSNSSLFGTFVLKNCSAVRQKRLFTNTLLMSLTSYITLQVVFLSFHAVDVV